MLVSSAAAIIYLNYGGNCRQAFRFYEEHLGGKITMMTTHGQQPNPDAVSPDWKDAILHARMNIGETELMGADVAQDRFQPMRSAYLLSSPAARKRRSAFMPYSQMAARSSCRWRKPFSPSALPSCGTSSARPG